jgi:hypothetical protein
MQVVITSFTASHLKRKLYTDCLSFLEGYAPKMVCNWDIDPDIHVRTL